MTETSEAFRGLLAAILDSIPIVDDAVAVRYDPPSGGVARATPGAAPNPTLDLVIDPRRWALSEEVDKMVAAVRSAEATLRERTDRLSKALDRWSGQ